MSDSIEERLERLEKSMSKVAAALKSKESGSRSDLERELVSASRAMLARVSSGRIRGQRLAFTTITVTVTTVVVSDDDDDDEPGPRCW